MIPEVLMLELPKDAPTPVNDDPSPENDVAVTMPLNLAPPSSYIVEPEPIGVSAPRTLIPAASRPTLCKFDVPLSTLELK